MFIPWSAYVLTAFGVAYGWLLHRAAINGAYRITGVRILDAFLFSWVIGLASGYTPLCLYLAFGFKEFKDTPTGNFYMTWIHRVGRAEVLFFILYAIFVLATVPQRNDNPITIEDIQFTIVSNIIFAVIAILFGAVAGWILKKRK